MEALQLWGLTLLIVFFLSSSDNILRKTIDFTQNHVQEKKKMALKLHINNRCGN